MGKRFWSLALVVAALVLGLPFVGAWARRERLPRCALDGVAIVPIYAVQIAAGGESQQAFCCIRCAEYWLRRESPRSALVTVTDEVTGKPIDADDAYFVVSRVQTTAVTGNQTHAFAERGDAGRHADQFHGRLLTDGERPFHSPTATGQLE